MGLSFTHSYDESEDDLAWHKATLDFVRYLDPFATASKESSNRTWWQLGSAGYTPQDLTNPAPIYNDRPYASLVTLSAGYSTSPGGDRRTEKKLEWSWGLLGSNAGYVVQTEIHRICCADRIPKGWSHQIGNGGSPTFMLEEIWKTQFGDTARNQEDRLGFHYTYGYSVGYYTRVLAGLSIQFGGTADDYRAHNDALPTVLSPFSINAASGNPAEQQASGVGVSHAPSALNAGQVPVQEPVQQKHASGFSVWAKYEVSYYLHNELLQGAWTGRNDVTFSYSQIAHVVHYVNLGVELSFLFQDIGMLDANKWRVYYTQQWASREISVYADQSHSWGGLYISRSF